MIRKCPICGELFTAKRSDAVYCSAKCRMKKQRGVPSDVAISDVEVDTDAMALVGRAHAVAEDMSRVALFSPAPVAGMLGRIAGRIEEALRGEGV